MEKKLRLIFVLTVTDCKTLQPNCHIEIPNYFKLSISQISICIKNNNASKIEIGIKQLQFILMICKIESYA